MSSSQLVIDASGALLGRLASYAAKQALLGKEVVIVNCNKIVISGNPQSIEAHYRQRRARGGSALKGPNFPRSPERIVKRTVRGMLPHRQARGLSAFKRVRCYNEIPEIHSTASFIRAGKEKPIRTTPPGEDFSKTMKPKPLFIVAGKRKTAVAKAFVYEGNGTVTYNGMIHTQLPFFHKLALSEPLKIAQETIGKIAFDISIRATGGGKEGQVQAARLALAKALVKATESQDLRKSFLKYDRALLVADTRRKEAYKPGDSKARAKRQKSYR